MCRTNISLAKALLTPHQAFNQHLDSTPNKSSGRIWGTDELVMPLFQCHPVSTQPPSASMRNHRVDPNSKIKNSSTGRPADLDLDEGSPQVLGDAATFAFRLFKRASQKQISRTRSAVLVTSSARMVEDAGIIPESRYRTRHMHTSYRDH